MIVLETHMVCRHCDATVPPGARFCPGCGSPSGAPKKKKNRTLIALIVVAVLLGGMMFCGIIGAIAIPNLLNAIDRGKQKRTMADIRSVAMAIENFEAANGAYPVAADVESLRSLLEGAHIRTIPPDGWGNPIQVLSTVMINLILVSELLLILIRRCMPTKRRGHLSGSKRFRHFRTI